MSTSPAPRSRLARFGARAAVLAALAGSGLAAATPPGQGESGNPPSGEPNTRTLYGVFRDFRAHNVSNGHPDFGTTPTRGRATYYGMAADTLDAEGNPVFASTGFKVLTPARDSSGRPICPPRPYLEARVGDQPPLVETVPGGACTTAANFGQWFRDVAGVNTTYQFPITMVRNETTGMWVFDNDLWTQHAHVPGFGGNKVYEYTYELETTFVYDAEGQQVITVGADDFLLLYIDGKLVADLGGNHVMQEQDVDLSRLTWLQDGQTYSLKIFYGERKKVDSWFKFVTNIELGYVSPPETSGLYD
ncbi:MAG TPA: fibro-slime domain-containing protein [Phycisphaerales bacterium]|nr:fibro-slime domain-containing protein [Phycisphaerales bacterium]